MVVVLNEQGEINGNIVEHEGPSLALFPGFIKDENEGCELPGK